VESYTIKNLTFTYPNREEPSLSDINLSLESGKFITIVGSSGCGKTTLLRRLKPVLSPHGEVFGEIFFDGNPIESLDARTQSAKIGFVMQNPENQIVTDKVWHELAFGLESLGCDTPFIRLRVAEMASFFGIQDWFHKPVTELSGGQKQLLSLASIMAMQPSVLILDEPTSQLDPIAASEFLAIIGKINREFGVTVILTEHRLEEVFPLTDRVVVMDKGRVIANGTPTEIGMILKNTGHGMFKAMPVPMRIYSAVDNDLMCPVTVRDGREWLSHFEVKNYNWKKDDGEKRQNQKLSIELNEVWFRYEKESLDVIKGLSLKAYAGEITAVLGGNGTGKTTALSLIGGLNKPYRGKVYTEHKPCVLPQNPQAIFVRKTVEEDLMEMLSDIKDKAEQHARIREVASVCRLEKFLRFHPFDLSGGEQQRAALAKVLLMRPRILLLDEPTKGLDAEYKQIFANILRDLTKSGVTIVMVSHDIEFCAEHADCCALFFDGNIVSANEPRAFFSGNSFYTSAANRMARELLPDVVTPNDVVSALGGTVESKRCETSNGEIIEFHAEQKPQCRKPFMALSGLFLFAAICLIIYNFKGLITLISGGIEAAGISTDKSEVFYGIITGAVLVVSGIFWALSQKIESNFTAKAPKGMRKLSKRTVVVALMVFIAIPLTIYIGEFYLDSRRYTFISILIILETMIPFVIIFESRKPQARELVIIAVLCAIGVAGRTAFFMLPQFKPVVAIVIISGVAFGGETGFLVGAVTGFVSNMFFGQGPWTPWQMVAFGIIGLLAGIMFRKGILRRNRAALCIYGGLATFFIYGLIMNTASIIMFQANPTFAMFLPAILQGIPFDLVHAAATVIFLLIISQPMLEKLDRIKQKYGLVE